MLNWNDYRYLLAVEAAGSMAAAARRLQVSQPTVGRRLSVLSKALGVQLLDVLPDGARLSEQGRRVCAQARVLEQQAALIELSARKDQSDVVTRIRLAASEGFAHAALIPLLSGFQSDNPRILIDLISGTRLSDLRHSEADIAVRVGDPSDEHLHGRIVGQIEFGLYAHESYLERAGEIHSMDDLNAHAIIASTGEIANLPQVQSLRNAAPRARVVFSSNSSLNQIDAMLSGFGILALPNYRARDLPGARCILSRAFKLQSDVWLLYRPGAKDLKPLQTLIDFFAREIPKTLKRMNA